MDKRKQISSKKVTTRISSKVSEEGVLDPKTEEDLRQESEDSSAGEEERNKAIKDNAEFLRLNKKPLQFGIEELSQYNGHIGDVIDYCQNYNNFVTVSWTLKEIHFWCMKTCKRLFWRKVIDFTGCHTTITTVAFSHYYRLYMIVTANFKMYFLNELFHEVH